MRGHSTQTPNKMAGETGLREYKMVDYWIYTTKRQKQVKRLTIVYNLDKESQKSIENRVKRNLKRRIQDIRKK